MKLNIFISKSKRLKFSWIWKSLLIENLWKFAIGNLEKNICSIYNINEDFSSMFTIRSVFEFPLFWHFWQKSWFNKSETTLNSLCIDNEIVMRLIFFCLKGKKICLSVNNILIHCSLKMFNISNFCQTLGNFHSLWMKMF